MLCRFSVLLVIHSCLAVWVAAFSPEALADTFEKPRYGGVILPISTPIAVRYRPFPKSPVSMKQITRITGNGETHSGTSISYGAYQGELSNEGVLLTISINQVDTESRGGKKTQKMNASVSGWIDTNGDIQDIKFQFPGLDTGNPKNKQALNIFEPLLKKAFPKLPNRGVNVGDSLLDLNFELDIGNNKASISGREIILGRSHYGGRDVLVADLTGTLQLQFGTPGKLIKFPMRGYSLVDIDTGIHLYSDATLAGSFQIKGKEVLWEMKQITSVSLPSKSKEFQTNIRRSIKERLEKVKRLLNKGLITQKEAAEKRKEILKEL